MSVKSAGKKRFAQKAKKYSKTGIRAEGMAERRVLIFSTAESMIRESASTDFSMRGLAEAAGLSTATTYNLIGSKATVLYHLLTNRMEPLFQQQSALDSKLDAHKRVLKAGALAVNWFVQDDVFFRPLFQHLLGVPDAIHRPKFMAQAYSYWVSAVSGLTKTSRNGSAIVLSDLARDLHVFFIGALDLWVHQELTAEEFAAQIEHGICIQLLGLVSANERPELSQRLIEARAKILPLYENGRALR